MRVTEPFPGFATDMQAQFMALMAVAEGASMITETIFENRFMHVPELIPHGRPHQRPRLVGHRPRRLPPHRRTGHGHGPARLRLPHHRRPGRQGDTVVNRVYHLDRGYERVERSWRASAPTLNV
jgi:UDP-N-acetylglucosamine 1-carboxyvinyltransferase